MQQAKQISLIIAITCWATLLGGILYSHIVFFPPYLSNLPESTQLISGEYGLKDENFWMFIHPLTILSVLLALVLNWKDRARRRFILLPLVIYGLVIGVTALYFVPELQAFGKSASNNSVTAEEWLQRGQNWQYRSWQRGSFMLAGFIMLLTALAKGNNKNAA